MLWIFYTSSFHKGKTKWSSDLSRVLDSNHDISTLVVNCLQTSLAAKSGLKLVQDFRDVSSPVVDRNADGFRRFSAFIFFLLLIFPQKLFLNQFFSDEHHDVEEDPAANDERRSQNPILPSHVDDYDSCHLLTFKTLKISSTS